MLTHAEQVEAWKGLRDLKTAFPVNKNTGTSTSSKHAGYGVLKGTFNKLPYWPCFGHFQGRFGPTTKAVGSIWVDPDPSLCPTEAVDAYFDWITGPDSPWRSFLSLLEPTVIEPYKRTVLEPVDIRSKEFYRNMGFIFHEVDRLPNNNMMNFLVATRMPKEWPNHIKVWHELVTKHGISKPVAMLGLDFFNLEADSYNSKMDPCTRSFKNNNKYDWPLDVMSSLGDDYALNFIQGTMIYRGPALVERNSYDNVNKTWGEVSQGYPPKDNQFYKLLDKRYHSSARLTAADCINILRAEDDRLMSIVNEREGTNAYCTKDSECSIQGTAKAAS